MSWFDLAALFRIGAHFGLRELCNQCLVFFANMMDESNATETATLALHTASDSEESRALAALAQHYIERNTQRVVDVAVERLIKNLVAKT